MDLGLECLQKALTYILGSKGRHLDFFHRTDRRKKVSYIVSTSMARDEANDHTSSRHVTKAPERYDLAF